MRTNIIIQNRDDVKKFFQGSDYGAIMVTYGIQYPTFNEIWEKREEINEITRSL